MPDLARAPQGHSKSWISNVELAADSSSRIFGNLAMPRDRRSTIVRRILPNRITTLANESAAIAARVFQQLTPFHADTSCETSAT
jgi:hypothetical protein